MKFFLYKLVPPRPNFIADISADETRLMHEHGLYWRELMGQGMVVAFGPVADPKGGYGIAILRLGDGVDPQPLAAGDPAIEAGAGFTFEVHPMPQVVLPDDD
ncbi:MAG TPA: YciI family protein [Rhodanobacteraceae bacterium]|nr:YciI family protein [Rhodanobacteraceae bacterium]